MQAMVFDRYGSPDVLRCAELPKPSPRRGELLIRVRASEVTKTDCEVRAFHFPVAWFWLPMRLAFGVFRPRRKVLGMYFAGEVCEVGPEASGFSVGDRVFGSAQLRMGGHGEYVCLPHTYPMAKIPEGLSFAQAASIPIGGLNAIHFMRLAGIEPGHEVLIVGAGGSIGAHALQIATMMGGKVTVVDAAHKEAQLREWGAVHFVDYGKEDFWQRPERYDVVFNLVAKLPVAACVSVLRPGGIYLTGNPKLGDMFRIARINRTKKYRASFQFASEKREELETLATWMSQGKIRPCIDRCFPLAEAALAHRRVETEERVGCVVLEL